MKTLFQKLAAGVLLGLLVISPVPAQNAAPIEAGTNNSSYSESLQKPNPDTNVERTRIDALKDLEKTRMDNEKDIQKTRLDNDKSMVNSRVDAHKMIIHDLAWNSWVLFAISIFFFGYLRDRRRHETIRLMVEKGTPLTPEILDGLRKKPRLGGRAYDPQGYLCWGITEVLVGIGLMIAFPHNGGAHAAGWIVLAVGIANLILWFIDRAHSNGGQSK